MSEFSDSVFALAHGLNNVEDIAGVAGLFEGDEGFRDHAVDTAAGCRDCLRDLTHESDGTTAVDEFVAGRSDGSAERTRRSME